MNRRLNFSRFAEYIIDWLNFQYLGLFNRIEGLADVTKLVKKMNHEIAVLEAHNASISKIISRTHVLK